LDTSKIVQSFKIIKFKKVMMISVLETSRIVQSLKIIKFNTNLKKINKKSIYNFCFGYFKDSSKFENYKI